MKRKGLNQYSGSVAHKKSSIKAMFIVSWVCVKFVIMHNMVLTKAPAERICWKENQFHWNRESALIMWFNCFHLQSNIQCARKEKNLITEQQPFCVYVDISFFIWPKWIDQIGSIKSYSSGLISLNFQMLINDSSIVLPTWRETNMYFCFHVKGLLFWKQC